jgi:hypothetical protein
LLCANETGLALFEKKRKNAIPLKQLKFVEKMRFFSFPKQHLRSSKMFLDFERKKFLILRDNAVGPGTDRIFHNKKWHLRSSKMLLNFERKKLLILRDNEIGPGADFSQ